MEGQFPHREVREGKNHESDCDHSDENGDVMKIELYPETAPNTVASFVKLCQDGFYDGLGFHRVIPGFMIQGGDPQGNGMGGPGFTIKANSGRTA